MQQTAVNRTPLLSPRECEKSDPLVVELSALAKRVQAISDALDTVIARELASDSGECGSNIVVLDDVTPCYIKANGALQACNAELEKALRFLQDAGPQGLRLCAANIPGRMRQQ